MPLKTLVLGTVTQRVCYLAQCHFSMDCTTWGATPTLSQRSVGLRQRLELTLLRKAVRKAPQLWFTGGLKSLHLGLTPDQPITLWDIVRGEPGMGKGRQQSGSELKSKSLLKCSQVCGGRRAGPKPPGSSLLLQARKAAMTTPPRAFP